MTTRNKRKLAVLNKENCEEKPRSNMAQNSGAPRSQEDYITQVSEKIEGRVTKGLSKEFSRTENRILGALLDDFLMNPLLPGHSGTTPEPTRNTSHNNQRTNEDGFQNDPHPEAGPFHGQTTRNVSLEEDHDKNHSRSFWLEIESFKSFIQPRRWLVIDQASISTLPEINNKTAAQHRQIFCPIMFYDQYLQVLKTRKAF